MRRTLHKVGFEPNKSTDDFKWIDHVHAFFKFYCVCHELYIAMDPPAAVAQPTANTLNISAGRLSL